MKNLFYVCVFVGIIAMSLIALSNESVPVYKIDYIDLSNNKQIVYATSVTAKEGSLSFVEVNSNIRKTIGTQYEMTLYEYLTFKEIESYDFPE